MKKLLVPIDFTAVTRNALDYAVNIASTIGSCDICMLHVVGKGFEQYQITLKQMMDIAYEAKGKASIRINALMREGSIFSDIGSVAEEQDAGLIIMGTHGTLGLKNLFGERAQKVITSSNVPFIVVEKKHDTLLIDESVYNDILCPINLTQKTQEHLEDILPLAKKLNSTIHLITYIEQDDYLAKKLNAEVEMARNILRQHNILYSVKIADASFDAMKQMAA